MSSKYLEVRRLQETPDGCLKIVLPVRPMPPSSSQTNTRPSRKLEIQHSARRRSTSVPSSRTSIEKALHSELQQRLRPQRAKVDQQIEERQRARLEAAKNLPPERTIAIPSTANKISPRYSHPPKGNVMDELKQRLNKICVSSNFEVDRIVKETKTTTITESKETIHFRPEGEKLVKVTLPESSTNKRLSLRPSPDTSDNKSVHSEPSHTYVNITELNGSKPRKSSPSGKDKDLLGEYVQLEEDIKDINKKNKELKEKFFQETKAETPILTTFQTGTMKPSSRTDSPLKTARPPVRLLTPQPSPSAQTETKTGCAFNPLKFP